MLEQFVTTKMKGEIMNRAKGIMIVVMLGISILFSTQASAAGEPAPDSMTGKKVGETIEDFTLKNQNGEDVSLSSLLTKEGTTALVFYRSANW